MVSFENGRFVLRRRDERVHSKNKRRLLIRKRVVLIVISFSFIYAMHRRLQQQQYGPQSPYSKSLRKGNATHADNNEDDDEDLKSRPNNNEPSQKHDVPPTQHNRKSSDPKQHEVENSDDSNSECNVSLNQTFIQYLQTLSPIPKKVHIFFPAKDYYMQKPDLQFVKHSILSLMKQNPEYNVTVYDDNDIDSVILNASNNNIITKKEADSLVGTKDSNGSYKQHSAHIVERSDLARILLMYTEGGFYIDADRLVNKRIKDVIQPNTIMALPTYHDINFCQDLIATSPNNTIFLSMIHEASKIRMQLERRKGWIRGGNLFELGPVLYNKHVMKHLFQLNDDDDGDNDLYSKCENDASKLRQTLSSIDGTIVTKKETDCDDGFLVDKILPECPQREDLYEAFGMKAWAPEVNKIWGDR